MSEKVHGPKAVRFVDISSRDEVPTWLQSSPKSSAIEVDHGNRVHTLHPPELEREQTHRLAPLLESLFPPAAIQRKVNRVEAPLPDAQIVSIPPPPGVPFARKPDTLIEQLIPRAEEEAAARIVAAVEQFAAERQSQLSEAEDELVTLVRVVAERVIAREIRLDPAICRSLIHEGLAALGDADHIGIRLGPFFADAVQDLELELKDRGVSAAIRVDPTVGLHGCVIETEMGRVDESVGSRIDRLLGSLTPEGPVSR